MAKGIHDLAIHDAPIAVLEFSAAPSDPRRQRAEWEGKKVSFGLIMKSVSQMENVLTVKLPIVPASKFVMA